MESGKKVTKGRDKLHEDRRKTKRIKLFCSTREKKSDEITTSFHPNLWFTVFFHKGGKEKERKLSGRVFFLFW